MPDQVIMLPTYGDLVDMQQLVVQVQKHPDLFNKQFVNDCSELVVALDKVKKYL